MQSEDSLLGGDGGMRVASSQPTKNAVREKCRELICKALRENTADELVIFTDLEELSALIEDNIFLIFGKSNLMLASTSIDSTCAFIINSRTAIAGAIIGLLLVFYKNLNCIGALSF